MNKDEITLKTIFIFWIPLAATWLMMATEGPFLAAIIARLAEPKYNLAAFGVAFSLGVFVEAPVIMMMSAATAIVKNKQSYIRLRNYAFLLNAVTTIIMIIVILPPVFFVISQKWIGLPEDVAKITHAATLFLIPWPAAIGYRRFYQGVLIRHNLTKRVAYGTVIRISSIVITGILGYLFLKINGAVVGTLALAAGVTVEAVASRIMAHECVKKLMTGEYDQVGSQTMSYRAITWFYFPLVMTSILGIAVFPLVTFFMGKSRMPIESLAVLPVIHSLVFVFRSLGISFQEVVIALMGKNNVNRIALRKFATLLGTGVFAAISLVAFTPLAVVWFHDVSGLSMELTRIAIPPTMIMAILPGLMVLLSYQRGFLVNQKRTAPITIASAIELCAIIGLLLVLIKVFDVVGVMAAAVAFIVGRSLATGYLHFPYRKALRRS